jgi:hypothetical protein
MSAKCTEEVKLRTSPDLLLALSKLANAEDRSLSEYCRMVLSLHAFGHKHRLEDAGGRCEGCNGAAEGPR